jgi:hypothetical protein
MHDTDEPQGFAVLLAAAVVILVIAYCRLTVGDAQGGSATFRRARAVLLGEEACDIGE